MHPKKPARTARKASPASKASAQPGAVAKQAARQLATAIASGDHRAFTAAEGALLIPIAQGYLRATRSHHAKKPAAKSRAAG